jgi:outer membrane protein OmpA-like peptidoglycan-associated protein
MIKLLLNLILASLFLLPTQTHAQSGNELAPGYYITVGVYAKTREDFARRFVEILNEKGYTANYGFNTSRDLYFVYLEAFGDLKQSITRMLAIREEGVFTDAWVRVIPGYIKNADNTGEAVTKSTTESKPVTEAPKKDTVPPTKADDKQEKPLKEVLKDTAQVKLEPMMDSVVEKIVQHDPMTLGNTEVFFSLFNARNNRIIEGDVQVIDAERNKLVKEMKGNDYAILPDPQNNTGELLIVADVFGYRKIQHELNYKKPLEDTVQSYVDLMGTTFVIYFDLVRYRKGDISTLYHVYFFNDAAVMLPSSKYELSNLLDMMNENRNYRIKLHGHTNGNYHGKIIKLGPEKNFFSLDGSVQSIGSAKDLSEQRAITIKEYLIANGIAEDRIEIKAWGGKRPLYDKHSTNAKKNVRVEVEVLQE